MNARSFCFVPGSAGALSAFSADATPNRALEGQPVFMLLFNDAVGFVESFAHVIGL